MKKYKPVQDQLLEEKTWGIPEIQARITRVKNDIGNNQWRERKVQSMITDLEVTRSAINRKISKLDQYRMLLEAELVQKSLDQIDGYKVEFTLTSEPNKDV